MHREALTRDPVWDCTLIKTMRKHGDTVVNPIYEWTDSDVWQYIRDNKIQTNPLYECGRKRIGCLFCPLAAYREKKRDEVEYPKYKEAYIRAFDRMVEQRRIDSELHGRKNKTNIWTSGQAVYDWWIEEYRHNTRGQITIEEYLKGKNNESIQGV